MNTKKVDEVNNNEEIRELLRQEDEERKLINTYIAIIDEKVLEAERLKREILYKER